MRARGAMTLLVSGGFTAFAEPVGEMLGFNRVEANVLDAADGLLTGTVSGRIVDSAFKARALIEARDLLGINAGAVLAVGDGANDGPMIEAAGLGIAYRAKPALAVVADARLDHHGLDALLWAQGIRRDAWVLG
jgi:phosphoserine phosphatase